MLALPEFDYQSNRHCAKTEQVMGISRRKFDYQSNRHCAKTSWTARPKSTRLITSQIDTVPKRPQRDHHQELRLITSQIDTVPKHGIHHA